MKRVCLFLPILLLATPVAAQSFEDALACYEAAQSNVTPDLAIETCTQVIETGGLSSQNMATAYYNRGLMLQNRGQNELAIADYDAAIGRDPSNPNAYYNRGLARARMGRVQGAIEDINAQWALAPAEVSKDQTMLAEKGYYRSSVDGLLGPGTQSALELWVRAGAP